LYNARHRRKSPSHRAELATIAAELPDLTPVLLSTAGHIMPVYAESPLTAFPFAVERRQPSDKPAIAHRHHDQS
jgi:hypothetical protein